MLIDDVTITLRAGDGGQGAVAFNKIKQALGPTGADGGNGGSIYFEGVSDISALSQFRNKKELRARHGENGKGQFNDGKDGEDLILKVPMGTILTKRETGEVQEITKIGEKILGVQGGKGGKGNFKFRSPTNTSPKQFQHGTPGEHATVRLELKLIADVGLIGLPNAGKSSLLNELTSAKSKVANYPFTTLEPNLGVYYELILADIPGLIEGASENKGLGIKFLKHIERTRVLLHLVSAESEDPVKDYKIVRKELQNYSKALAEKPEYLFLSKSDAVTPEEEKKKLRALQKIDPRAFSISIHDWERMEKVRKLLNAIKSKK